MIILTYIIYLIIRFSYGRIYMKKLNINNINNMMNTGLIVQGVAIIILIPYWMDCII